MCQLHVLVTMATMCTVILTISISGSTFASFAKKKAKRPRSEELTSRRMF